MAEKKTVRTRNVAFRVTSEEYEQVEKLAAEAGLDPNTWCHKVLVAVRTDTRRGVAKLVAAVALIVGKRRECRWTSTC
jgi:hypothetical protein